MGYKELKEIKELVGLIVNDKKKINDKLKRRITKLVERCIVHELNRAEPDNLATDNLAADNILPLIEGVIKTAGGMDDE